MKKRILITILCLLLSFMLILSFASCQAAENADAGSSSIGYAPEADGDIKLDINGSSDMSSNGDEFERKIIKTINISSETKSYDTALVQIEELCNSVGGYIENSSTRGTSLNGGKYNRYASYTLRIPASNLDIFNNGLGGILNIVSTSSNADEITSTYYDIKSRIEVLELQKESLQGMYDNYTDYSDVDSLISLQDKLFAVIEEIEAYQTQIRLYDNKVSYSTVYLSISEVLDYTENKEDDSFFEKMGDSIIEGWDVFLAILTGIATVIAFLLPELILATAIITPIVIIAKKKKKNRKMKKSTSSDTSEPQGSEGENPYTINKDK